MPLSFETINLAHQTAYLEFLKASPVKASDYSFVNLWGWSPFYGIELSFDDDLVWIRQTRPEVRYWAPMGDWGKARDFYTRIRKELGRKTAMIRVPEKLSILLQDAAGTGLGVGAAREQWDYLYALPDLVNLPVNR